MSRRSPLLAATFAGICIVTVAAWPAVAAAADAPTLSWIQVSSAASPSGRTGPAMAYDPVSRKVVLFGGFDRTGYLNDTWTFDGTSWTQEATPVAPPLRVAATMAFDRVTRQIVLFGGYDGNHYLGDTWLWDGATSMWTQASPTKSPTPVTGPTAFTDPANGRVDVYGGFDGRFYQLETWRWMGTTWKHLHPTNSPSARSGAVVALNTITNSVVLFAGLADVNPYNTWTWDGTDWTQQFPPVQPPSRYFSAGAFDPHLGAVVAFGGGHGGGDLRDTWLWTGTNWKFSKPTQSPPRRESFGMAYDTATGHVVIFGGQAGPKLLNDTWELDVQ